MIALAFYCVPYAAAKRLALLKEYSPVVVRPSVLLPSALSFPGFKTPPPRPKAPVSKNSCAPPSEIERHLTSVASASAEKSLADWEPGKVIVMSGTLVSMFRFVNMDLGSNLETEDAHFCRIDTTSHVIVDFSNLSSFCSKDSFLTYWALRQWRRNNSTSESPTLSVATALPKHLALRIMMYLDMSSFVTLWRKHSVLADVNSS